MTKLPRHERLLATGHAPTEPFDPQTACRANCRHRGVLAADWHCRLHNTLYALGVSRPSAQLRVDRFRAVTPPGNGVAAVCYEVVCAYWETRGDAI